MAGQPLSTMLRLERVVMRYGQGPTILHEVDLALERGDFRFIVGPTGAGKTSLLRVMGLLHPPCAGRVIMFEHDTGLLERAERTALRRRIGVVFQDLRLFDHLSTFDNVALPLRIDGGHGEQISAAVCEILAWLGLSEVVEANPLVLSMGQRQLVAIARAVIARPNLLLCDEPTSNIDSGLARRLMHLFTQLSRLGTAVVISTHNHDLVARYPHPVLQMANGRLTGPAPAAMAAAE